jgi:hypothetical protein
MERVTGMHIGFPVVMFTLGKYGSSSGTGIGKHSGCTVVIASHGWQSRMDSPTNPEWGKKKKQLSGTRISNTSRISYRIVRTFNSIQS